jgi:hypothetical protein
MLGFVIRFTGRGLQLPLSRGDTIDVYDEQHHVIASLAGDLVLAMFRQYLDSLALQALVREQVHAPAPLRRPLAPSAPVRPAPRRVPRR